MFNFTAFISNKYCAILEAVSVPEDIAQMYRIFYRHHRFEFAPKPEDCDIYLNAVDKKLIKSLLGYLGKKENPVRIGFARPELFQRFYNSFRCKVAGGGAVFNDKSELLLIHRLGLWDLPKGKLERDELPEDGAIREVEEECNVSGLTILRELKPTYHLFFRKVWMLKKTHWYEMHCEEPQDAKPQLEEGIHEVKWMKFSSLKIEQLDTYPSIRDVLHQLELPEAGSADKIRYA
jgi:ADP-ribose pyrophosphatase YjhB (NUDIX family)